MKPFLKWPGGKRWFTAHYPNILPNHFDRYVEPFLGSGSVFFYLQPRRALLGDVNEELINVYRVIKNDWSALERLLRTHQEKHSATYYYRVREFEPDSTIERAARLIYLNRTCFNGIYRVNAEGRFNTPMGTRQSVFLSSDNFEEVSRLLQRAEFKNVDFARLIGEARRNDLVFADPPYTAQHNENGFIRYNETLFSWSDQVRLANALAEARSRGAKIVSTNANHESIRLLYRERGFALRTVSRFSSISAKANCRRRCDELVLLSV